MRTLSQSVVYALYHFCCNVLVVLLQTRTFRIAPTIRRCSSIGVHLRHSDPLLKYGQKWHSMAIVSSPHTHSTTHTRTPKLSVSPFLSRHRLTHPPSIPHLLPPTTTMHNQTDNPPDTFCWDVLCGNEDNNVQVQDRDDLEDKNVDERVAKFIDRAYWMASYRKGDVATMNVQWNMGSDFNYENAERYFINMVRISRRLSIPCLYRH